MLDQLSLLLSNIKQLRLRSNLIHFPMDEIDREDEGYNDNEVAIDNEAEIDIDNEDEIETDNKNDDKLDHTTDENHLQFTMPHTNVDCIIFEKPGPRFIYLKV